MMGMSENKIQMVDLKGQYEKIKEEVDAAIQKVVHTAAFINGPQVADFSRHLEAYLGTKYVIPCANGTDALQMALMALGLNRGDEVIVPAFTYVATAEVIGLLGLTPVMVDVDYDTFNITIRNIEKAITKKTKAIVPVHLFGQSCDMGPILDFALTHRLYVVEDNAQAIGAEYVFDRDCQLAAIGKEESDTEFGAGCRRKTGTIGHIGCTSFFPSKNLGCYGDGGAMMTDDAVLAERLRMIANHGQQVKYHHKIIGCNSRLDTIQAAVLDIKLKHLDEYGQARYKAAQYYTQRLKEIDPEETYFVTPKEANNRTHVYHQYTLKIMDTGRLENAGELCRKNESNRDTDSMGTRDALKEYLAKQGIPSMIYYPLPLQEQEAFKKIAVTAEKLNIAKELAGSVLSLPMHTELTTQMQDYIVAKIKEFYSR